MRLSPTGIHDVVRRLCQRAGLPEGAFGSHSLRSGWITEAAGTDGVELADIMPVSSHVDPKTVLRYVRPVYARRSPSRKVRLGVFTSAAGDRTRTFPTPRAHLAGAQPIRARRLRTAG